MSKQYIVKTEIDTVTVEANSAREAVKMVAEGRKISGRSGKLTIRAGRSTISNVLVFHVRKSSDKFYRERWQVTEAPVEVVAEVATVEAPVIAEVVAEQIEANTDESQKESPMSTPTFLVRIRTQFEIEQINVAYYIAQEMATDMPPSRLQFMVDVYSGVAEANNDDRARAMAQAFLDTLETIIG